ncbi:hypothetical protein BU16DRAFT_452958 [Lophium mytilinum]|uniref:Zn(2)-C6 fungal-type domain-containing protein n=1 Tax=Lophium mytilinum TaxID=390894 RepID=A0A6A6R6G7_9PEZI|nr:hypothetical protein BU16DRAFT_452958 [Lophium mytilinum]
MSAPPTSSAKPVERVNLACLQCRARHVKCDSSQPICNRCRRDGKACDYAKSRRGGLDKAALAQRRLALLHQQQEQSVTPNQTPKSCTSSSSGGKSDQLERSDAPSLGLYDSISIGSTEITFAVDSDRLVQLYFEYFHAGHPFLLPQQFFTQRLQSGAQDMKILEAVVQYVGSRYAPWATSEVYRRKAESALAASEHEATPFRVQALLLFSITNHYCSEWGMGSTILETAISLALALGMNTHEFSGQYGEGSPVLEESWRRTFWSLYVTEQHYAVVKRIISFTLRDLPGVSVGLPCEEIEYESGVIPQPKTLADYDIRELDEVEVVFSSFTYLIDGLRIVSELMRNFGDFKASWEETTVYTDARLSAWSSLLPACKKESILPDGSVDEVMFFAHLTILILTVQIHRPASSLAWSTEEWQTAFIPRPPMGMVQIKPERRNVNTAKVLRALEKQTQLLTLPSPLILHAPFTMCIVAGFAAAHVASCTLFPDDRRLAVGRDRLRLCIGAIRACADIWPLNRHMLRDAQNIAKGTLSPPTIMSHQTARAPLEFEVPEVTKQTNELDFDFSVGPMSEVDIFSALEVPGMPQDWSALLDPSSLPTV